MSSEFTPSQAEVALTAKIFEKADPAKLGILTGDVAVNVFSGSKLPAGVLGEVWSMADRENDGFLTRKGVAIALRLMGHAQRGEPVTEALLKKPGMPPTIEGYTLPILQQNTGGSVNRAKSPTPGLPQLTAQDKAKFMKIFLSCNPVNGMLNGEKAGEVFVKSKLPVEKLSQIWTLADTHKRGSLDSTDFSIAMYLIQACMSGQLSFVPTSLPPGLYEQAAGRPERVIAHSTGGSSGMSPMTGSFPSRGPIQPQYTGQQLQPQSTGQRFAPPTLPNRPAPSTNAFAQPQVTGQPQWDVTAAEKANSDQHFDTLDTSRRGFVEGDVVVPFMLQSKLPEETLAHVWDLADLNNDGRLTREGFAVAVHLINKKLAGQEVPGVLPNSLIPPSMRGNIPTAAAASPPPPAQDSLQDLLWDDPPALPASPPPQPLQPQRTGPMQSQSHILQPQRTGTLSTQNTGALSSQNTGIQQRVASPPPLPQQFSPPSQDPFGASQFPTAPSAARDLLGDDEDIATSPPLRDQSAEIGNVTTQLSSTERALDTVKKEREDVEQSLQDQAIQLSNLQTQLASAKAAYETETKLLETLRERYAAQNNDIRKAREELITAESDVSGMKLEKNEVQGQLLRDKEEVRELQKKMAVAGATVETLKADIEKAKKEAKQQKGLLAIAKKQLATREAERAKAEKELEDSRSELGDVTKEREEAEEELAREVPPPAATEEVSPSFTNGMEKPSSPDILQTAIAQPLPSTPDAAPSPPASIRSPSTKSTNPFDRLTLSGTPRSGSPFLPFASSSEVPTPTGIPARTSVEDPFGFSSSRPFTAEPTSPTSPSFDSAFSNEVASPSLKPDTSTDAGARNSVVSDNDDLFTTPPSTAAGPISPDGSVDRSASFPGLDAAASNFPDLSTSDVLAPPSAKETDLNANLKELEVDESDSSDEEPESVVVKNDPTQQQSTPAAATSAFDDTFGFSSDPAPQTTSTSMDTTPTIPFHTPEVAVAPVAAPAPAEHIPEANGVISETAAGKNAFDEAMGTIPSGTSSTISNTTFGFDSAFDDNFDFAAAKAETDKPFFPPPTSSTSNGVASPLQGNGFDSAFGIQEPVVSSSIAAPPSKSMSFDDAFGATSTQSPPANNKTAESRGISFENAFGGQTTTALAFDDAFAVPGGPPTATPSLSLPAASPPGSPKSHTAPSSTASPPSTNARRERERGREASPSPDSAARHSSPKARPPAQVSLLKEPATKHSRLSIRLPFGKKKKQEAAAPPLPPARSSQLSPPIEDPVPGDDDIDTVKQLTAMGFSRDQAVTALERNSYDFQRALNSLLGTQ